MSPLRQGALLAPAFGDAGLPVVLELTGLPAPAALHEPLTELSERFAALTDPRLVRPLWLGLEGDASSLVLAHEHIDARPGLGERHAGDLGRRLARAGLDLLGALTELHAAGLPHGDLRPSNVRVGPFALRRPVLKTLALDPARVEQAPAAAPAVFARLLGAGAGETARVLVPAGTTAPYPSPFDAEVLVTSTAWGVPGYAPLGRFAAGATVSLGGELFSLVLTLLELLTQALPWELPRTGAPEVRVRHSEEALRRFAQAPERRARLAGLLLTLEGNLDGDAQGRWLDFFDQLLGAAALEPEKLEPAALAVHLEALAGAPATGTIPLPLGGGDGGVLAIEPLADEVFGGFEAEVDYEARVLLDALADQTEGDASEARGTLRFRWERMLGSGAMGSVHRVAVLRDGDDPLPCALKLALDASATNRDAVVREARVLRARSVAGIARFVALLELPGGIPALVTEFAPGRSLDRHVKDAGGKLTTAQVRALGERLFETLSALHANASGGGTQVVHGDIKPENILVPVDSRGAPRFEQAVLIDFGISLLRRRLAAADALTTGEGDTAAVIGGTPGYMPQGHLRYGATPPSDVFAVGVSLYCALTGEMPWKVENASRLDGAQLAVQLELRLREGLTAAPISLRALPPWRRNAAWNRFFREVLAAGDPQRIPSAAEALARLRSIGGDAGGLLLGGAVLTLAMALVAAYTQWAFCPAPQVRCAGSERARVGGACARLDSENHCGACGHHCDVARGERCVSDSSGTRCALVCPAGLERCGDACIDLRSNRSHCGACGHRCGAGQVCAQGRCALNCGPGLTLCGPRAAPFCAALGTDNEHCGACDRRCEAGAVCREGRCELECPSGQRRCGERCVDPRTDRSHCGACGVACEAGAVCSQGHCATSCGHGLAECAGVCRDLQSDRAHCGACANACGPGTVCAQGHCLTSCAPGQSDCAGACYDLRSDERHCGSCGRACEPGQGCEGGACALSCPASERACAGQCVDPQRDDAHCGACGRACEAGQRCEGGACALSCPGAQTACGGRCADMQTDEAHCGACGHACEAHERCEGGTCALRCAAGLSACGSRCVDTQRDEAHCGACGHGCESSQRCEGGSCALSCGPGTRACGDRCVDTQTDESHCGACGRACEGAATCRAGQCIAPEPRPARHPTEPGEPSPPAPPPPTEGDAG